MLFFCLTAYVNNLYAQGKLQFEKETHDFGTIAQGTPVSYEFKFKNTGNQPLVISNVVASCGCTTPEYSKEPIAPGGTSKLKVGYNAAAMGHFEKAVNVKLAGVNDPKVITITGEVVDANAVGATAATSVKASTPAADAKTATKVKIKTKKSK